MGTFCDNIEFQTITPTCCNVPFAMSESHYKARQADKKTWYCPSCGGGRVFIGKTPEEKQIDKLKKQLQVSEQTAEHFKEQRTETRRMYNRIRQRIQKGVCPCCDKQFPDLRDHMKAAHDLTKGEMVRTLRETYGLTQSNLENETGVHASYISMYENGKKVPEWAQNTLENWSREQVA